MIVKNEARTLERTLRSALPLVDSWCILDTGSTDGTQDLIRRVLADVPGELHEELFVDFAASRNRVLELCRGVAPYALLLDADDEVTGALPAHALDREPTAHYVAVELGDTIFDSARIAPTDGSWRYVGRVHEVLTCDGRMPAPRVPGLRIVHHVDAESGERSRARWARDVDALRADLDDQPGSLRALFYLGMTLRWLGRYEAARDELCTRASLGGWAEEAFYARLSAARCSMDLGDADGIADMLAAHAMRPSRAEPLYDLAMHYHRRDDHALAVLFASRAASIPLPDDRLFVERCAYGAGPADIVAIHAWYLGEYDLGERAARIALASAPDDPRLRANLAHYTQRITA